MSKSGTALERAARVASISLRETPTAGALLQSAVVQPATFLHERDAVLLFIHGYNVDEAEALAAYDVMRRHLGSPWNDLVAGLLWPGDGAASAPGRVVGWTARFLRPLTYPHQPARAAQAAEILMEAVRDALQDRQRIGGNRQQDVRPLDLHIVAHSMGCRLALELIRLLRSRFGPSLRLRLLVSMAAAVPLYLISHGGPLAKALRQADRLRNYRSGKDAILKWAFRPGQLLERPFPYGWKTSTRGALGRLGVEPATSVEDIATTHGHSGYWSDSVIAIDVANDMKELQPDLAMPASRTRAPSARRDVSSRKIHGRALPV